MTIGPGPEPGLAQGTVASLASLGASVRVFCLGSVARSNDLKEWISGVLREGPWDAIVCPAPFDRHPGRRAIAFALLDLIQSLRVGDPLLDVIWNSAIAWERSDPLDSAIAHSPLDGVLHMTSWQEIQAFPITVYFSPTDPLLGGDCPAAIGVVVRTRNRPVQLWEALASLQACTHKPAQVVVVNDGAPLPEGLGEIFPSLPLRVLNTGGAGRGAAANAGLRALTTDYAAFLDDDDLVYPHHYAALARALADGNIQAAYTDALSVIYRAQDPGQPPAPRDKILAYSRDFDADWLLYDNYIPFHTLVFKRDLALAVGPVREDLPVFEDWEFLVRLSRLTPFVHVRKITCEYRHFPDSQTLGETPQGKRAFVEGRRRVLHLTRALRTPEVEERLVKTLMDDRERFLKERVVLGGETQFLRRKAEQAREEAWNLHTEIGRLDAENRRLSGIEREAEDLRKGQQDLAGRLDATYAEIHRLNSLLGLIYASKTWKAHQIIQRIKSLF